MADIKYEDFTIQVKNALADVSRAALHEASGEIISQTKRNSRVKTGKTKNSFKYKIVEHKNEITSHMGSNDENAIWEELGTGEYALKGDGRKGGWWYATDKPGFFAKLAGKKPSNFVFTYGKKPSRAFYKAYTSLKNKIVNMIQNKFKGL